MKSNSGSLYSKLKVLVAKLYKAEKLYSSMRTIPATGRVSSRNNSNLSVRSTIGTAGEHNGQNLSGTFQTEVTRGEIRKMKPEKQHSQLISQKTISQKVGSSGIDSSGVLIEHANEIRASEWYNVHHVFREKLNFILEKGNSPNIPLELNKIWHEFSADFEMAELAIREATEMAKNAIDRQEYAHLLKVSSELIRRKARLQALKVIHDELNVLVSPARRSVAGIDLHQGTFAPQGNTTLSAQATNEEARYGNMEINISERRSNTRDHADVVDNLAEHIDALGTAIPSNVIPLRRKAAS